MSNPRLVVPPTGWFPPHFFGDPRIVGDHPPKRTREDLEALAVAIEAECPLPGRPHFSVPLRGEDGAVIEPSGPIDCKYAAAAAVIRAAAPLLDVELSDVDRRWAWLRANHPELAEEADTIAVGMLGGAEPLWHTAHTFRCSATGCSVEVTTADGYRGAWHQLVDLGWHRGGDGAWLCPSSHEAATA